MLKTILAVSTLALAGVALPSQAALLATWDVSANLSGQTEANGLTVDISGGGSGGTATLDTNGIFSILDLNGIVLNLDVGFLGGANLALDASGDVIGSYNQVTQQLSGNTATLNITDNGCSPYGLAGGLVCDAVPATIDFSSPFLLTAADGLTDPITFDLVNNFSFLLGDLDGVASLELSLSNVVLSPIPIPAAAWLFGSALLGLGAIKRSKA